MTGSDAAKVAVLESQAGDQRQRAYHGIVRLVDVQIQVTIEAHGQLEGALDGARWVGVEGRRRAHDIRAQTQALLAGFANIGIALPDYPQVGARV